MYKYLHIVIYIYVYIYICLCIYIYIYTILFVCIYIYQILDRKYVNGHLNGPSVQFVSIVWYPKEVFSQLLIDVVRSPGNHGHWRLDKHVWISCNMFWNPWQSAFWCLNDYLSLYIYVYIYTYYIILINHIYILYHIIYTIWYDIIIYTLYGITHMYMYVYIYIDIFFINPKNKIDVDHLAIPTKQSSLLL